MKAIKKQKLSAQVVDEIYAFIKSEKLKEGDRLPSVSDMSDKLQIGRSTLREALQILESRGAIQVINGKGIFVNELRPFYIHTMFDIENEQRFLLEILEVREALEKKAIDLAISNIQEKDIKQLQAYLTEYEEAISHNDRKTANQADASFHEYIYRLADNDFLNSIINSVGDQFEQFWNEPFGIEHIFDESYPYHHTLLEGLAEQDIEKAQKAFDLLIQSVRRAIKNVQVD